MGSEVAEDRLVGTMFVVSSMASDDACTQCREPLAHETEIVDLLRQKAINPAHTLPARNELSDVHLQLLWEAEEAG